jgi:hypothetical protein
MISVPGLSQPTKTEYVCGPVRLTITFADNDLHEALHALLSQYDAHWPPPMYGMNVAVRRGEPSIVMGDVSGAYFQSWLLRAERRGDRLISASKGGVGMELDLINDQAVILVPARAVPSHADWPSIVEETEQQLILLLARAWAKAGWTPLHAGSLVPPGEARCVLVCAPSGVGKTTLIAALLRRGWRTLGDDKTLLQIESNGVTARALARRFHLHPSSAQWFPELGDFSACPRYSRWTDKRVVKVEPAWPDRLLESARPAAVVQLERIDAGLEFQSIDHMETLYTLLRQVALPGDAEYARPLVKCIGWLASSVNSALLKVGHGIYDQGPVIDNLEQGLLRLLP